MLPPVNPEPHHPSAGNPAAATLRGLLGTPAPEASEFKKRATALLRPALFRRLVDTVAGWFQFPFGYEDADGFHYGQRDEWDRDVAAKRLGGGAQLPEAPEVDKVEING